MRESASPPRTPTVVNGGSGGGVDQQRAQSLDNGQDASSPADQTSPLDTPPKTTSQLDLDFPKLNAPKPKSPRNMDKSQSCSSDSSKSVNSLDAHSPTANNNTTSSNNNNRKGGDNRNLSPCSQHSNKELSAMDHDNSPLLSPGSYDNRSGSGREHSKSPSGENRNNNSGYHSSSSGKKHNKGASGAREKNAKPRLKAQGSSSSVEGSNNNNNSSNSTVFISKGKRR